MTKKVFTLSIETAVQGGSISLLQGATELDHWIGLKEVSKSEDVLQEVKNILERNDVKKDELKRIVVSTGPGSHTGVRIGMAVGIGVRKALNCELLGVFVLEAMLPDFKSEISSYEGEIVTAVPIGRNQVCRQSFNFRNQKTIYSGTEPQISTVEDFSSFAGNGKFQYTKKLIIHRKLYLDYQAKYKDALMENNIIIDAGENIAVMNGILGVKKHNEADVSKATYVRDSVLQSF